MMRLVTITRDAPLCDGTPRREKGFRAVRHWREERGAQVKSVYATSPLFKTRAEAEAWVPEAKGAI